PKWAILARVVEEVVHELAKEERVGPDNQRAISHDLRAQVARSRVATPAIELLGHPANEGKSLGLDPCTPGVGQEEERVDTLPQPRALGLDTIEDLAVLGGGSLPAAGELDLPEQGGQRVPELVGGVAREPALALGLVVQPTERVVQAIEEAVEG